MNNSYQEYIKLANKLADAASITSMQYFRASLDIDNKSDQSPVTIADKNTALKIDAKKRRKYISHNFLLSMAPFPQKLLHCKTLLFLWGPIPLLPARANNKFFPVK